MDSKLAPTILNSLKKTHKKNLEALFPEQTEDFLDLLNRFLVINPNKRCSAEEALKHPYVAKLIVNDQDLISMLEKGGQQRLEIEFNDSDLHEVNVYQDYIRRMITDKEIKKRRIESKENLIIGLMKKKGKKRRPRGMRGTRIRNGMNMDANFKNASILDKKV